MIFKKNKVKSSEERKENSIQKIKELGIIYLDTLPLVEDSTQVKLKKIDDICKRAIAALITTQLACDIDAENDYEESREFFSQLLQQYNVQDYLLESEKAIFNNAYTKQNVIDAIWAYEAYWSLVWALGLIDNIESSEAICDCEKAITLVSSCKNYEEFKAKTKLRDIEEILDMVDLYYRYHWATTEQRINPNTPIGNLNPDIVVERRKGLEWLISDEEDWNAISLDT